MTDKITINPSLNNAIKIIVLGGGIIMLGGFILDSSTTTLMQVLGLLNALLGFSCVIIGFLGLLHIKPKITLNETGIRDNRILKEFISWNNIEEVELIYENRQNKLLISLTQQIEYSKLSFLYRNQKSNKSNQLDKKLKIELGTFEVNYAELVGYLKEKNIYKME